MLRALSNRQYARCACDLFMTLLCRRRLGGLVGALLVLLASGGATEAKPLPAVLTARGGVINS